jgi:hypothetical protein
LAFVVQAAIAAQPIGGRLIGIDLVEIAAVLTDDEDAAPVEAEQISRLVRITAGQEAPTLRTIMTHD